MTHIWESKIFLVYGFSIEEDDETDYELDENIKMYNIPFYGDANAKNIRYIGIKFGEVKSVFDHLHYSVDAVQITKLKLKKSERRKFDKKYPDKKIQNQAIIQGIYTSHYVSVNMYCGYFVKKISDDELEIEDYVEENIDNLEIVNISHNITDKDSFFNEYIFIGKCLTNYETFEFTDECEPGNKFYNILKTRYSTDYYDARVKFKSDVINLEKIIAFVPEMCYCYT